MDLHTSHLLFDFFFLLLQNTVFPNMTAVSDLLKEH